MIPHKHISKEVPLDEPRGKENLSEEIALRMKPVFLGNVRATTKDYYRAFAIAVVLIMAFLITIPAATKPLPAYPTLVVVYDAFVLMLDLITAFLLFTQVGHMRERSLVVMGCGYVFTTVLIGAHAISLPDAFRPGTLIGGSGQVPGCGWVSMASFLFLLELMHYYGIAKQTGKKADRGTANKPYCSQ